MRLSQQAMDRLPHEILIRIGEHLQEGPGSGKSLRALSLSCRKFHTVFQSMIYNYIEAYPFSVSFVHLIIRLWKLPELAGKVRRLDLSWTQCDQQPFDGFKEDDEVTTFIQDALSEIFTPDEEEKRTLWEEHLSDDYLCAEAWLGLLLVKTTNIQVIEFGHENSELMSDILHKAAKREQPFHNGVPFPHLQEVRACVDWGASWINSDFLLPFFHFPAVRKIYGSAIGELKDENIPPLEIYNKSCPVQEIHIDEGYWCRGMLDWLALCTKLESISISIEVQADEYEISEEDKFDASVYREALLPFASTLKTLRISYGECYSDQLEEDDLVDIPFGTFKDFVALEHLTIQHSHLIGRVPSDSENSQQSKSLAEILPCSLTTLQVLGIMDDYQYQLFSELLELSNWGFFENLKQLVLHICSQDDVSGCETLTLLKGECETKNIDLKIQVAGDW